MLDNTKLQIVKELQDKLTKAKQARDDVFEEIDATEHELKAFLALHIGDYHEDYLGDTVVYYKAHDPYIRNLCKLVFAAYNNKAIGYKEAITFLNTLNIQRISYDRTTGQIN